MERMQPLHSEPLTHGDWFRINSVLTKKSYAVVSEGGMTPVYNRFTYNPRSIINLPRQETRMSEPWHYTFPSPLVGYQGLEPLPSEKAEDGKSYINPPTEKKSEAYSQFVSPITNGARGGFDIHIYFLHTNPEETKFAAELWERIRREFPELRIYRIWDKPIGPHPLAMFEVNLFTPEQFGAFVPWLVINRGPLSALIHPNTDDELRDHTQRATWMGQPLPLYVGMMKQ